MNIFETEIAPRLAFILGILNLVSGILVLLTCRCIPVLRLTGGKLMQNPVYKAVYKYHCFIWWVFWISVIIHAIMAIGFYGVPY